MKEGERKADDRAVAGLLVGRPHPGGPSGPGRPAARAGLTVVGEQVPLQGEGGPEQRPARLALERPLLRVRLRTRDTAAQGVPRARTPPADACLLRLQSREETDERARGRADKP